MSYDAVLALARTDYAKAKERLAALEAEQITIEDEILKYGRVIIALGQYLGEPEDENVARELQRIFDVRTKRKRRK